MSLLELILYYFQQLIKTVRPAILDLCMTSSVVSNHFNHFLVNHQFLMFSCLICDEKQTLIFLSTSDSYFDRNQTIILLSGDLFELFAHFLPYEFPAKRRCQNPRDRKLIYFRAASRLAVSFVQLPAILLCKNGEIYGY